MKIADVNKTPDGETTIIYSNDYTFIGDVDENGVPIGGIIKTPEGQKYTFANFGGNDIYDIIDRIKNGECEINLVTELK